MKTRREFVTTATTLFLAGCMGGNEQAGDGNGNQSQTGGGSNGNGNTRGSNGGNDGDTSAENLQASIETEFDAENETVTVTLTEIQNAEYVDVVFGGDTQAKGRLNEVGDSVTLKAKAKQLDTSGNAEDLTAEAFEVIDGSRYGDEVIITAKAISGNASKTIYNESQYLGSKYVTAYVDYLFHDDENYVRIVYSGNENADYVDVIFSGDASAKGRLHEVDDELILRGNTLETVNEAENLTEEANIAFDGAQDGDTIRVQAIAYREPISNVVTDKEGSI
ncbi:MAG: hypothetical protein SXQ77_02135 [Halobacteria archaeon]|nr:hypothetical protein [Halobacteria archaeon]